MVGGGDQSAGALAGFFQQSEQLFGKKKTSYVTASASTEASPPQSDEQPKDPNTEQNTNSNNNEKKKKNQKKKQKKQKKQKQKQQETTQETAESSKSNEPSDAPDNANAVTNPSEPQSTEHTTTDNKKQQQQQQQQQQQKQQEQQQREATEDAEEAQDPEKSERTIFVGNVSLDATHKDLKQFFSECGKVEKIRLRSLPVAGCKVDQHGNQKLMKKVCANKKIFSESCDFCNAYIRFETKDAVDQALQKNGALFFTKNLHVDRESPVLDPKRSVFVGNLPFRIEANVVQSFFDKNLRKLMPESDESDFVEQVRIIRDRESGMTKGFCYVRFKDMSMAAKALALNNAKLQNRELRVSVCGKRFKNKKGEEDVRKKYQGLKASAGAAARIKLKRKFADSKLTPHPELAAGGKPKKPKHAARKARQAAEAAGQAKTNAQGQTKTKAKSAADKKQSKKPQTNAKPKADAPSKAKAKAKAEKTRKASADASSAAKKPRTKK